VGFTASYVLGFPAGFGAEGIWVGLTLGLLSFASLLVWRFHRLTARGYLPDLVDSSRLDAGHAPARSAAH
jgi:MATE family multidrug resistance protein